MRGRTMMVGLALIAASCSSGGERSSDDASSVDRVGDESGYLAVTAEVAGVAPRTLTGWWSPAERITVLLDGRGDEVMRVDGEMLTVPSFAPGVTVPWSTFDLAELDRGIDRGLSYLHAEGSGIDLVLALAGGFAGQPFVEASASLLDTALAQDPDGGEVVIDATAAAGAWPRPIWVTMIVDCVAGIDVEVVVGEGTWSISHPIPTVADPDARVRVEFTRTDTTPPELDGGAAVVVPDPEDVDRLAGEPVAVPCTSPALDPPPDVDCALIEPVGVERGPEPCDVFALLVERQSGDGGAIWLSMSSPLNLDGVLDLLPQQGLEMTGLELTWASESGPVARSILDRLAPPATSVADAGRVMEEFRGDPGFFSAGDPLLGSFQLTGSWGDLARFVAAHDVYSLSLFDRPPKATS